ncbi:phage tail protein [Ideonella sp. A 288]|uniref:phage tail protein n=1 Tax=Ideonella sp. A 288 TaxID=1962181 RepID=UPI000B4A6C4F|nr:tail fiber protein [Ideonella sp. A 288]
MDPFVGEIRIFAGNFAPRGWALCNGQLLPIVQNTALFSLLGTQYGGDGRATFALPDLQARAPIHHGQGPGLSPRTIGESGGEAAVALTTPEMPSHTHGLSAVASPTTGAASAAVALSPMSGGTAAYRLAGKRVAMDVATVGVSGAGAPHENRQPHLVVNFIIALQGVFPPRS